MGERADILISYQPTQTARVYMNGEEESVELCYALRNMSW